MATNPHFSNRGIPSELDMSEDLIIEGIKAHGVDVMYVPRMLNSIDRITNEVTHSSFERSFTVEMRVEGFEGYSAANHVLDKLGLSFAAHSISMWVSKRRFREEVPAEVLTVDGRPNEGDLIYIPHVGALMEIRGADHEDPFKSGGKIHVYKLDCEFFKSSSEPMPVNDEDFMSDLTRIPDMLIPATDPDDVVSDQGGFGSNDQFEMEDDDVVMDDPGR